MKLLSVNVGQERAINAKSGTSGIFKQPQQTPVFVGELGLEHDSIIDTKNHGGPDQAVYIYFQSDYEWWGKQLGKTLSPGTFGENLTIDTMQSTDMHIDDRLEIGELCLEITFPRIPCSTLAARMEDKKFVRTFLHARRPGAYCRVIKTGSISAGDDVTFIPASAPRVPINDLLAKYIKSEG